MALWWEAIAHLGCGYGFSQNHTKVRMRFQSGSSSEEWPSVPLASSTCPSSTTDNLAMPMLANDCVLEWQTLHLPFLLRNGKTYLSYREEHWLIIADPRCSSYGLLVQLIHSLIANNRA